MRGEGEASVTIPEVPLFLIGAGGHAREVLAVYFFGVRACLVEKEFLPPEGHLLGVPVRDIEAEATPEVFRDIAAVVAVGDPALRRRLADRVRQRVRSVRFAVVMDPSVVVKAGTVVEEGAQLLARCVLGSRAKVGKHAVLNHGCILCHDAVAADFATLGPGVILCGRARVGEGAQVGAGAVILPGVQVGPEAVVGAGAVVTEDVPSRATWAGVPARPLAEGPKAS